MSDPCDIVCTMITYDLDRPDLAAYFFVGFALTLLVPIVIACLISDYRNRKSSK